MNPIKLARLLESVRQAAHLAGHHEGYNKAVADGARNLEALADMLEVAQARAADAESQNNAVFRQLEETERRLVVASEPAQSLQNVQQLTTEWQRTLAESRAETQAARDRGDGLRAERDRLRADLDTSTAESVRLHGACNEAVDRAVAAEADARLGRLVRAMPGGLELFRQQDGTRWHSAHQGDREPRIADTPEAALLAAGVVDRLPAPPAPETGADAPLPTESPGSPQNGA